MLDGPVLAVFPDRGDHRLAAGTVFNIHGGKLN